LNYVLTRFSSTFYIAIKVSLKYLRGLAYNNTVQSFSHANLTS
jgi:hypothetical protein